MGRRFCFSLCMLMLCVCWGCSSSVVSDGIMRIDVGEALDDGRSVGLSRYGSAIEYVPLESVPQSLLREGSRIFYDKGKFFIVSHFLSGADDVPFFDESGKYLGSVGKAGRGPGEYNQLWGFTLEDDKEVTNVCIAGQQKGVVYDLSGQYISEISFEHVKEQTGAGFIFNGGYLTYLGDGRYCLLARSNKDEALDEYFFVLDSSGNIIKQFNVGKAIKMTANFKRRGGAPMRAVSIYGSSIYGFYGNIRQISRLKDTLFAVDCENGSRRVNAVFAMYGKPFGEVSVQNENFGLSSVLECDKFLLQKVNFPTADFPDIYNCNKVVPHTASAWLLYDKAKRSCTALKYNKVPVGAETSAVGVYAQFPGNDGFLNDLDGGMPFLPSYIKGGKMYQLVDASVFIEMAGICSSARMKEVAAQLTEESNPVVVVVTIK